LAEAGHRLAVCTNKLEWLSKRLLDTLQLAQRFAVICGQDTFGMQKPDPEIFRRTVIRAGGEPVRAIMVGDSLTDIRTARAANVPVIAVDFGYTDVPIATLRPDRIISSFTQLPAAILGLRTGKKAMDDAAAARRRPDPLRRRRHPAAEPRRACWRRHRRRAALGGN
jgi:phosphoglycolate phosphatase